ncbi:NAD-dependent succinate-semialdehyde dehydrogenase [Providencia vermicola]|uniref:NAD-dependent succinate-semialdehyde dehydrogenase n=1 Tax=Providencia stuartii TaxID=588 RepID=A0AAI9MXC7_PROST|nr:MULTISPECIES: NAD-dependent succinate-semialdehyde dehydrogenase [Providencia]ELR5043072.1 NAD-dependent succinate-semialdehyde dehydrogenase [Providencia rettgeri]ELR5036879.1 NAD-dependent succinate-semialdehyde dehydrogenase [Providencia stuartii]ELR5122325.1 NAD-dependent succinate-semialdehyde dehydrogenase [Providencia stuartii]ELR5142568.1 NAD-dependent succinate-semialdehyde dehydrogenase [Providencia stuartii]ELR5292615.1 NAD-dependent succinate-semialdehyde dehydrogenase [Providen
MNRLSNPALFRQSCYINGQWVDSAKTLTVTNPVDQSVLGTIPSLSVEQVNDAIIQAHEGMLSWSKLTAKQRSIILHRWFTLIEANVDDLGLLMTLEQGKPFNEAKGEIRYAASFIEWFAEEGKRVYGETIPQTVTSNRILTIKQPIGVCSAITPWNFPAAMITRKAAPALAAGCSMLIKPASETPFTALALAELAAQAGIPAGVFNVVTGESRVLGELLTRHPLISKFSFTGSTQVGRQLYEQCASTIKKTSLELGGNAPFIVFDDADIDKAVSSAIQAKFRNGGQTCVCVNRFYIHDAIYEQFLTKFVAKVSQLRVGNGLDEGTDIGPMITSRAIEGMHALVDDAIAKGARKLTLGNEIAEQGHFINPKVLVDVDDSMDIVHEEIFGPIAAMIRFHDEDEVIRRANATIYGLAAYFFSKDIGRVYRVAEKLQSGMVGINTGMISNEVAPFGGVKQSGLGKEGSRYGIEDYLTVKYLCIDIA